MKLFPFCLNIIYIYNAIKPDIIQSHFRHVCFPKEVSIACFCFLLGACFFRGVLQEANRLCGSNQVQLELCPTPIVFANLLATIGAACGKPTGILFVQSILMVKYRIAWSWGAGVRRAMMVLHWVVYLLASSSIGVCCANRWY
jgi:hypothetical protein